MGAMAWLWLDYSRQTVSEYRDSQVVRNTANITEAQPLRGDGLGGNSLHIQVRASLVSDRQRNIRKMRRNAYALHDLLSGILTQAPYPQPWEKVAAPGCTLAMRFSRSTIQSSSNFAIAWGGISVLSNFRVSSVQKSNSD